MVHAMGLSLGSMPRMLFAEDEVFTRSAMEMLEGAVQMTCSKMTRAELLNHVHEYDILWIRLQHAIDKEVIDRASCLRMIVSPTTGLTHIDLRSAADAEITILSLQHETAFLQDIRATAEFTIGLMLSLLRRIPAAFNHVCSGSWDRDKFEGTELRGKTVGIVGYGRLGRIVARYLSAFDVKILCYDEGLVDLKNVSVEHCAFKDLLEHSDIVSLHASVNERNHHLFNATSFRQMKQGAFFINTARGELVDEIALLQALESGHLAGAALDVLEAEQTVTLTDHPLRRFALVDSRLIITPHIGGRTVESLRLVEEYMAGKLLQLIKERRIVWS